MLNCFYQPEPGAVGPFIRIRYYGQHFCFHHDYLTLLLSPRFVLVSFASLSFRLKAAQFVERQRGHPPFGPVPSLIFSASPAASLLNVLDCVSTANPHRSEERRVGKECR